MAEAKHSPAPPGAGPAATPKSAATKPSEVLDAAANLIEPEGAWCQGQFHNGLSHCMAGAILLSGGRVFGAEYGFVSRVAILTFGPHSSLAHFNDAHGRTQAEVVSALRQAAELARSEGC